MHRAWHEATYLIHEGNGFGTWNVCTLRGTGKPELLANEMKQYKLSIVAVTETYLASEGEMPFDEEGKYIILFTRLSFSLAKK